MIKKINRIAIVGAGFSGAIVEQILQHGNITLYLHTKFNRARKENYDHVFYSGPIDAWFDHQLGRLAQNKQSIPTFFVKPV